MAADPVACKRVVVLVGVDGSQSSLRARAYAVGMARRSGAHLIVIFVRQVGALASLGAGAGMAELNEKELADQLRGECVHIAEQGVDVEFIERAGNPYKALTEISIKRQADAIIVGASQQTGHRLVGSLAVHLVRNATCPVTVVP